MFACSTIAHYTVQLAYIYTWMTSISFTSYFNPITITLSFAYSTLSKHCDISVVTIIPTQFGPLSCLLSKTIQCHHSSSHPSNLTSSIVTLFPNHSSPFMFQISQLSCSHQSLYIPSCNFLFELSLCAFTNCLFWRSGKYFTSAYYFHLEGSNHNCNVYLPHQH